MTTEQESLDEVSTDLSLGEQAEQDIASLVDGVLRVRESIARVERQRDLLMERVDRAARYQIEQLSKERDMVEGHALPIIDKWLRDHPPAKGRTAHLSTGSIGHRDMPSRIKVANREELIEWAREHAAYAVVTKHDVDVREITSRCGAGDLPPGLERTEAWTDLVVKPPKEER